MARSTAPPNTPCSIEAEATRCSLRELVLAALETGLLGDHSGLWRLERPIGQVRRAPRQAHRPRGWRIGDNEREALEIVAFAEPVDPKLLARLTEATDLESLEAAGLITVTVDGGRRRGAARPPALRRRTGGRACRPSAPCGSTISSPTRWKQRGPARTTACDWPYGDSKEVNCALRRHDRSGQTSPLRLRRCARRAAVAHGRG